MIISILLVLGLALLTFTHWKNTALASMVAPIVDTPYRYCYVSTWRRYVAVVLGYCFVFFTIIWGGAFLLTNMTGALFGVDGLSSWQAITTPLVVLFIYGLFWLPGIRNLTLDLHKAVIRHLFFPIFPSNSEEYAIDQLLKATEALEEGDTELTDMPADADRDLQRQLRSMIFVHSKLAEVLSGKGQSVKSFVYGEEWSLINSLYQSVLVKINDDPHNYDADLLSTIQLCQYYCCHLMVRYLFSTSLTSEQLHQRFYQMARPAAVVGV